MQWYSRPKIWKNVTAAITTALSINRRTDCVTNLAPYRTLILTMVTDSNYNQLDPIFLRFKFTMGPMILSVFHSNPPVHSGVY